MFQIGNIEQINLANNKETLYNNFNESESGYNEQNNGQTIGRNDETTRLYEESKPQQDREYSWEEYNRWEQSVKPIEINKQAAEEFGLNKIIDHENFESDILHNENTRDILSDIIESFIII